MNKKALRIAGWALGLSLAVAGIGTVVCVSSNRAIETQAVEYDALYESGSFTGVANHSYTQNKTFTLNNKSWTASVSQVNGGIFYLGCNSNNASKGVLNNNATFSSVVTALAAADSTYNTNKTTAHAYALLFDNAYNDVSKVQFNWSGGNNAFQVYLFGKSAGGYTLLASTNYSTSGASVAGSVTWTGSSTNYTGFAIAARPGATNSTATNKTLRAESLSIYKTKAATVSSVSLSPAADATLKVGQSKEYTVAITGTNLTGNETVTLSYDEAMLGEDAFELSQTTRKNGETFTVTAVAADGAGELYATYSSGGDPVVSNVITLYSEAAKTLSGLVKTGTCKTSYVAGQEFDPTGLTVTANYESGDPENVTSFVTWSPSVLTVETETVTGSYTESGVTKTVTVGVSVESDYVDGVTFDISEAKTVYYVGDTWNSSETGITATASYVVGADAALGSGDLTYSGYDLSSAGQQTVTVSYPNPKSATPFSTTYSITVKEPVVVIGAQYLMIHDDYVMTSVTSGTMGVVTEKNDFFLATYALTVEAGSVEGTYAFKNGSNYITCNTTASSGSNNLWTSTTKDTKASWYVTSNQDGTVAIRSAYATSNPREIRFNTNSGQARFACYRTNQDFPCPNLLRVTDTVIVGSFVEANMKMSEEGYGDSYNESRCNTNYSAASAAYTLLTGPQKLEFATNDDFAAAKARFSWWAKAHGDTFNEETGAFTPKAGAGVVPASFDSSSLPLIATIATLGTGATVGFFLFQRKRKEI